MDMKKILKAVWFTPAPKGRWGLPLLIEGPPGAAKTSIVEDAARAVRLPIETVIASLREPSDFNGLPIPVGVGSAEVKGKLTSRVMYAPPHWAVELFNTGRGVVFFDEINTAAPAVQAALLRVILDGVVGDTKLPSTVRFVAAMNPTEQAAGGWDLAPPLANRFGHWMWDTPDAAAWGDWILGAGGAGELDDGQMDPAKEEARVEVDFHMPFAKARGLVAGFVKARPELLLKMPEIGNPQASKAWPSPRTWEYAARAMAGAEVHGLSDVETDMLVTAFVGSGPASELATYRRKAELPDPYDILDGRVTFKHSVSRLDRTVAVLSSCAAAVTGAARIEKGSTQADADKLRLARAAMLWKIIGPIAADTADLAVGASRALVKAKLSGVPEARQVLIKMQPILQAAGIDAN